MNIIDLYKSILDCGSLTTNDEGFVSVKHNNNPVLVDGKRLVLPIHKQLSSGGWDSKMVFHPLSESVLRGESEIITKMRSVFNIRLNSTFAAIGVNLLSIIASTDDHKKLNPEQSELLSAISEVDKSTLDSFVKIMTNVIKDSTEKGFIHIFLKRGGIINGKKFSRVGVVTFPFYEELQKQQETYYGVKLRSKDRIVFIQLCEYMLPNLNVAEHYNYGSESRIAPYLDALMGTVLGIASKFNDILETYSKEIDDSEMLVFNADWVEAFENLEVMLPQIRQIPVQQGNEGKARIGEQTLTPEPVTNTAQVLQTFQPPVQAPVQQPWVQQPQHQPMMQPQQQSSGLIITDKGLDFSSLLRSRPQIASAAVPIGQQPMYQPVMQQPAPPRWAMPQQQVWNQQPQQMYQSPQPMYQQPQQQYSGRGIV